MLSEVSDSFALIGFRFPDFPYFGGRLTDEFLIDPVNNDPRLILNSEGYPLGCLEKAGAGIPCSNLQVLALDLGLKADSVNFEFPAVPLTHADDDIEYQHAVEPPQGLYRIAFGGRGKMDPAVLHFRLYFGRQHATDSTFGALDFEPLSIKLDLHSRRNVNRDFS